MCEAHKGNATADVTGIVGDKGTGGKQGGFNVWHGHGCLEDSGHGMQVRYDDRNMILVTKPKTPVPDLAGLAAERVIQI